MFFKELIKNVRILRWIKDAKQMYIQRSYNGMCLAFNLSNFRLNVFSGKIPEDTITEIIPEYTRKNLGADFDNPITYWWPIENRKVRIEAFDKLIDIYKKKLGIIGRFLF